MGDVVNLRLARKRRRRAEQQAAADENRVIHGRTKAEKRIARDEQRRADQALDGHRLDDTETDRP